MMILQEPLCILEFKRYFFIIMVACISSLRCDPIVKVTEGEHVNLKFPYPCDSNKVTIQMANRAPFYNSAEPESLDLPFYQLNRFSVTDMNCLVQVQINPVKRSDEATYICKPYRNGVIHSKFAKRRLHVNYPPRDASCTLIINDDAVGDWVILQCTAPAGSLAGGIYCYQDSKQLPPQSKLAKIGETLKQTIWARRDYPVFCCSSTIDQPKDMCECNDFVWDPSETEGILNPCPVTTAGQGAMTTDPTETSGDHLFTDTVNPSASKTYTNTCNIKLRPLLWAGGITILILITVLVIVVLYLCHVKKTNTILLTEKKEGHPETQTFMTKVMKYGSQTSLKIIPTLLNTHKSINRSKSWGYLHFIDIEGISSKNGPLKANSMGTLGNKSTDKWGS